jgi:hypothetical protein
VRGSCLSHLRSRPLIVARTARAIGKGWMSALGAFDSDGEPIDVPSEAVAWQVRRAVTRGRPQPVYTCDGLALAADRLRTDRVRPATALDNRAAALPTASGRRGAVVSR